MFNIMLIMVCVPLLVSLLCWWMLGKVLRQILAVLCQDPREEVKRISGLFWQRLYFSLTMLMPLLCVLLFAPDFKQGVDGNLLYALRWSIFGAVFLLLTLAYLVRRQIHLLQRNGFVDDKELHDFFMKSKLER